MTTKTASTAITKKLLEALSFMSLPSANLIKESRFERSFRALVWLQSLCRVVVSVTFLGAGLVQVILLGQKMLVPSTTQICSCIFLPIARLRLAGLGTSVNVLECPQHRIGAGKRWKRCVTMRPDCLKTSQKLFSFALSQSGLELNVALFIESQTMSLSTTT